MSVGEMRFSLDELMLGNDLSIRFRSFNAVWERYSPFTFVDMWTICRVTAPFSSIRRRSEPMMPNEECVIPTILCFVGMRYAFEQLRDSRSSIPAVGVWQPESAMASTVGWLNVPLRLPFNSAPIFLYALCMSDTLTEILGDGSGLLGTNMPFSFDHSMWG